MMVERQRSHLQAGAHAAVQEAANEAGESRAEAAHLRGVVTWQREEMLQGEAREARIRSEASAVFNDVNGEVTAVRAEALRLRTMLDTQREDLGRTVSVRFRAMEVSTGRARAELEEQRDRERIRARELEGELHALRARMLEQNSIATDARGRAHFAPPPIAVDA